MVIEDKLENALLEKELAKEEENHASLLRSGRDYYLQQGLFPEHLLCSNLTELKRAGKKLDELYSSFEAEHPSEEVAFNVALWLEASASEAHYQFMMNEHSSTGTIKVFQQLNGDDKDHLERIKIFMRKKGIQEKSIL